MANVIKFSNNAYIGCRIWFNNCSIIYPYL